MKKYVLIFGFSLLAVSCVTSLEENLEGTIDAETAASIGSAEDILTSAYQALGVFGAQDQVMGLQEHPSDEMKGPTRGPDWDDGGIWRELSTRSWSNSNRLIGATWTSLLTGIFRSTQVLEFQPTAQQTAEARFLRALFSYNVLNFWGLVLGREAGEDLTKPPSIFLGRADGIDFVISELEEILPDLPDTNNTGRATKNAARALLARAYLNKAVYKATDSDSRAQKGPFNFDVADMDKVIQYTDDVINSGQFSLDPDYFDSFRPDNADLSSENIFVVEGVRGSNTNSVQNNWRMTLHINQNPSGWNGFVTLSDLYDSFEETDVRRGIDGSNFPELAGKTGLDAGFLLGQQFDENGNKLKDRTETDLVFTKDFSLINSNERQGIRIVKYIPDFENSNSPGNDYVLLRYADVLLMKAEAILRGGTSSESAASIVNNLRAVRGASPITVDLTSLLAERARELYWEGLRRTDQIRFGTFMDAFQEAPASSDTKVLLYPIPPDALSTNPVLIQNPGY